MGRRELQIADTVIGEGHACYVIAEIGCNHQGDVELCARMIEAAAGAGASAVKLQKRDLNSLFTKAYGAAAYTSPHAFGATYLEHRQRLELDESAWRDLVDVAHDAGVDLIATAFDEPSGEFLAETGVAAIKVASGDATNLPLIARLIELKLPILASTGGLNWPDIDRLVDALSGATGAAILQCTSIYPCPPESVKLPVIAEMRARYPGTVIGYSGHELGIGPSIGAAAFGAALIERHFTTDRTLRGADQHMSILPHELEELVRHTEAARRARGDGVKECLPEERPALVKLGKKLVAARAVPCGTILTADDLAVRSPGDGLSPASLSDVVGQKLTTDLEPDDALALDHVEWLDASRSTPSLPTFRCDGRVAVVTGAAGTLGPLWARTLTAAGATTVVIAQPGTEDQSEVHDLQALGAAVVTASTTDAESLHTAARDIAQQFGPPEILVANAGLDSAPADGRTLDLGALHASDVEDILRTNTAGTIVTVSAFGSHMVTAGRGSIVLVASQYALVSPKPAIYQDAGMTFTKNPAYGASKAAVAQLAQYFAAHWGGSGVRVNALSPGGVDGQQTPQFKRRFSQELPLGRMIRPEELQGALLFLATDASTAMTGAHLVVDGGYTAW